MIDRLKLKDYLGYAITDMGNNLGFSVASTFLIVLYTDVIGIHFSQADAALWGVIISGIMIAARVWDGINDPIMGFIAQKIRPSKTGKFRRFLLIGGIPLALIFVIMFIPFKGLSLPLTAVIATITYIAYGMIYTVVLVPYGSLATVMTRDPGERSKLSIARSIGGGIGGIPAGMLLPMLIYYKNADGGQSINEKAFFIAVVVIAVIILLCYVTGYFLIKEQYPYTENDKDVSIKDTFRSLLKNKPFIIIGLVGMLLIASSMYINSISIYLCKSVYEKSGLMTWITVATYAPEVLFIIFSGKIIKKIGKKEMCFAGLAFSTVISLVMFLYKITNPIVYIVFVFLEGIGIGFITLEIWALAMDVIDYQEFLTHERNEAPCYAIFTFLRKIGQALAAVVPALLVLVGYDADASVASDAAKSGIYDIATLVPFILFALMTVLMAFYPLNKKKDAEMREALVKIREERGELNGAEA